MLVDKFGYLFLHFFSVFALILFVVLFYSRYYGQKILYMLMSHQDFEKMMNKHVPASTLRNIQDKIDSLKRKVIVIKPSYII